MTLTTAGRRRNARMRSIVGLRNLLRKTVRSSSPMAASLRLIGGTPADVRRP